jgi:hypothetical protein
MPPRKKSAALAFERLPDPVFEPDPAITRVHLLFKTHFDVGFTDFAATVTEKYFTTHWPNALALTDKLREMDDALSFRWATGSWLVHQYLERLKGKALRRFEAAIHDGAVTWHALPYTFGSESMQPHLFRAAFRYAEELEKRFGTPAHFVKATDVPGHTRGVVPILAAKGVKAMHLGINPASAKPALPLFFRWVHPSGAELPVILEHDYGGTHVLPGTTEAFCFSFTSDNHGPQTLEQVQAAFAKLRQRFPKAKITTSSFNELAAAIARSAPTWPTFAGEIGDSWIRGYGSDPWKMSRFRELQRLRGEWQETGRLAGKWVAKFDDHLLCVAEHTWGMDEKSHLTNGTLYCKERTYQKAAFLRKLKTPTFRRFASSWTEQRNYVQAALQAVQTSKPHAREVAQRLSALEPRWSNLKGFAPVRKLPAWVQCGQLPQGDSKPAPLAWEFIYEAFGSEDYQTFKQEYVVPAYLASFWAVPDFTKPGMEAIIRKRKRFTARVRKLWHRKTADSDTWILEMGFPKIASVRYGAPREIQVCLTQRAEAPSVSLDLNYRGKDAYRGAEALWLKFSPGSKKDARWLFHKMGELIAADAVCTSAGRQLHGIDQGVVLRRLGQPDLLLESLDAALAGPGLPNLLGFKDTLPAASAGVSFHLYNNTWTTNFPMWNGEDAQFRFQIRPSKEVRS